MALPVSVFIITKNEEQRIEKTISAVTGWVDEVIVVDSGSTDSTVEICKSLGAKVFHNDWHGFGAQKRFAEDQCANHWWLNLDADEIVTPELKLEVSSLFANAEPEPAAYKIRILNIYPGDLKPRLFANDYNVVRLYHKSIGRYRDHPVYDRVELEEDAKVKQITAPIWHFALNDWAQMIEKANASSSRNLEKLIKKPRWVLILRIFAGFPLNLLRNYVLRGHIFGGWKGFIFATGTAFHRTMRVAKALAEKEDRQKD